MWASVIPVSTSQQCGKDCYSVCVCIVPACHQPSTLASWSAGIPSRFCWSPSAQCVVLVGGAFWRTLSWLGLMLLSQGFHRVSLPCSSCEDMARKGQLSTRKRALTRAQPCWCLELGHLSLQNCEKKKKKPSVCVCVCMLPSLWYFVPAAEWTETSSSSPLPPFSSFYEDDFIFVYKHSQNVKSSMLSTRKCSSNEV